MWTKTSGKLNFKNIKKILFFIEQRGLCIYCPVVLLQCVKEGCNASDPILIDLTYISTMYLLLHL